jgi:AcrR family transcriptional regulator
MSDNSNTVKKPRRGDLRPALLQAAERLLAERGVDGFSLRETARRTGVSPAAHAYYFKDTRALLTAIATAAFDDLADRLAAAERSAAPAGRVAAIRAQAEAYAAFAIDAPAKFDLMWRKGLLDTDDGAFTQAAERAFFCLDRLVRGEQAAPANKDDPALAPTLAWWSLVHGFACLANEGAFADPHKALERLLPAILDQYSAG